MKIYTRRGDGGQTDLFHGGRVSKDDLRVEAYGTIDELNSFVGLAQVACADTRLRDMLTHIQSRLFEAGSDLATPLPESDGQDPAGLPRIGQVQIDELESFIDEVSAPVPDMKYFILPGGSEAAARLHVCRCVCRRAERIVVHLMQRVAGLELVQNYLNRLSDLFFAMARRANQLAGVEDVPWLGRDATKLD